MFKIFNQYHNQLLHCQTHQISLAHMTSFPVCLTSLLLLGQLEDNNLKGIFLNEKLLLTDFPREYYAMISWQWKVSSDLDDDLTPNRQQAII